MILKLFKGRRKRTQKYRGSTGLNIMDEPVLFIHYIIELELRKIVKKFEEPGQ